MSSYYDVTIAHLKTFFSFSVSSGNMLHCQVFSTPEPDDACHHRTHHRTPTPRREKSQLLLQTTASFEKKKKKNKSIYLFLIIFSVENTKYIEIKDNDVMNGEGNGNPLQYSCLERPTDIGAWWAAVHAVAKSWTRRKQLSTHDIMKSQETFSPLQQLSIFCQSVIYISAHTQCPCSYHLKT